MIAVAALFAALPGCDRDEERPVPVVIDEVAGSYGSVRMGTSEADVRRVFGEAGGGDGFSPLGESFGEIGGAPAVRNWPPNDRAEPTVIRSEHVARGTVGERIRIWFGEDPIRSMTLARVGRA